MSSKTFAALPPSLSRGGSIDLTKILLGNILWKKKEYYHKGGIMSEDIGGFLLLPKNIPKKLS